MGNIVILDENTANQIAAGEVIERPASVIKELVENSIDARATSITVEIKNGGISYIKVVDNGSGIASDDIVMAFERHATSKIRTTSDLENILTMGFRGEALASIASVSKVELTSKTQMETIGTRVIIHGGKTEEIIQTGVPNGTKIIVKDLFFNTPARYKFLKRDATEAGYITDILTRLALAHPQISFKLINNYQTIIHTPGNNDLNSVIFSVYGREVAQNILKINYEDDKIKITGYIGKPEITKSNRNYQSIFLNSRWIKNKMITAAIDEAYKTLMMKHKFPFVVVQITVNPALVDVNVHPTKMEVRFSEEGEIFRSMYHAVSSAIFQKPLIRESDFKAWNIKDSIPSTITVQQEISSTLEKDKFSCSNHEKQSKMLFETIKQETSRIHSNVDRDTMNETTTVYNSKQSSELKIQNHPQVKEEEENKKIEFINIVNQKSDILKETKIDTKVKEISKEPRPIQPQRDLEYKTNTPAINQENVLEEIQSTEIKEFEKDTNTELFQDLDIIGQVFSTYIILQKGSEIIWMDQHAAHERVRYEELKEKFSKGQSISQTLLAPIVLEVSTTEQKMIMQASHTLRKIGFEYEEFGHNAIVIRSIPLQLEQTKIKENFMDIFAYVSKTFAKEADIISEEVLHKLACKSAVKANKKLSEDEILYLLEKLKLLKNPFTCPHGRPTLIKMQKTDLEKMFKRIV